MKKTIVAVAILLAPAVATAQLPNPVHYFGCTADNGACYSAKLSYLSANPPSSQPQMMMISVGGFVFPYSRVGGFANSCGASDRQCEFSMTGLQLVTPPTFAFMYGGTTGPCGGGSFCIPGGSGFPYAWSAYLSGASFVYSEVAPAISIYVYGGIGREKLSLAVVPEPSTYALMTVGLLVLGITARKRGKSRACPVREGCSPK
jgi:hypothetical protein